MTPEFSTYDFTLHAWPPHSGDPEMGSALYWAVRDGKYDVAALLVEHGADVFRIIPSQALLC